MSSHTEHIAAPADPPVYLDIAYAERLQNLAEATSTRNPDVSERLLHEIERATILPAKALPDSVVTIGSTVTYRDHATGDDVTLTLVMPADADINARRVSVLTPIGAALIGLRESAQINWPMRNGSVRRLTILRVLPPSP